MDNKANDKDETSVVVRICLSHFMAKWVIILWIKFILNLDDLIGSQAFQLWDFTIPLTLLWLFPNTFLPAAMLLFFNTL